MSEPVLNYAPTLRQPAVNPRVTIVALIAMAAAGVISIVVPVLISPPKIWRSGETFVPAIRTGIESFSTATAVLLVVSGVIGGAVTTCRPVLLGLATMSVFPILAFAEMVRWPTSHNLIPFELMMYAALTVPGVVGAFIGRGMKRLYRREKTIDTAI